MKSLTEIDLDRLPPHLRASGLVKLTKFDYGYGPAHLLFVANIDIMILSLH